MKKNAIWLVVLLLVLAACIGVIFGMLYGISSESLVEEEKQEPVVSPGEIQSEGDSQPSQILLEGDTITVTGSGFKVSGSTVTIMEGGTYSVSGTLDNGQIYVDAGGKDTVTLSLNGVDILNDSDAAIYVENAGQTILMLGSGTQNRIQSGNQAEWGAIEDDTDENASGAAIYARDDLAITGDGTLKVFGYINNGIHTTNNLTIDSGNIEVTAKNNGIKGKDSVNVTGGTFSIRSGGDGIKSDDSTGEGYGVISISGGTFTIETDSDGLQAETELIVTGGEFTVASGGGSEAVSHSSGGWGDFGSNWDMEDETSVSTKGFKSGTGTQISGGTFTVNSKDDGFHSNGSIYVTGGSFIIASGDDGIHADTELTIEAGDIQITTSYEGLEANQMHLLGGNLNIKAADDGLNAYGGQNNMGWGGSTKTTEEMPNLYLSGADIVVDAGGDGLDSNGNLYVEGGTVIVNGPTDNGNGALDSGSENGGICKVSGGTVFAIGSSGMAETFGSESEQCVFRYYFSTTLGEGNEIVISDDQGNVLFEHMVLKSANSLVFSCPELQVGKTYQISVDGESTEIEQTEVSVTAGQSAGGRGFGGRGGRGGMRGMR